jgi:hypothetical protein
LIRIKARDDIPAHRGLSIIRLARDDRLCERSEAIQISVTNWIASSSYRRPRNDEAYLPPE